MEQQLLCKNLEPGDVLLKVSDGSIVHHVIQAGQAMTGGLNPGIIHAGMMFDKTAMIEAQANGISANDLRVQNKAYGYYVYRCVRPDMARGAATCAKMMFDINRAQGTLRYNLLGALTSIFGRRGKAMEAEDMDALLSKVLTGRGRPFFCSQFVVFVYQFVAEQMGIAGSQVFALNDAKAPTSELATRMVHNPYFREAGWLFPNAR